MGHYRRGGKAAKRRFGGKPTPSRLYKEMNPKSKKAVASRMDFIVVAFRLSEEDFTALMRGKLNIKGELYPILKEFITNGHQTAIQDCLGKHTPRPRKVAFFVQRKDGVWLSPELRCVCVKDHWEHHDLFRSPSKRKSCGP